MDLSPCEGQTGGERAKEHLSLLKRRRQHKSDGYSCSQSKVVLGWQEVVQRRAASFAQKQREVWVTDGALLAHDIHSSLRSSAVCALSSGPTKKTLPKRHGRYQTGKQSSENQYQSNPS